MRDMIDPTWKLYNIKSFENLPMPYCIELIRSVIEYQLLIYARFMQMLRNDFAIDENITG